MVLSGCICFEAVLEKNPIFMQLLTSSIMYMYIFLEAQAWLFMKISIQLMGLHMILSIVLTYRVLTCIVTENCLSWNSSYPNQYFYTQLFVDIEYYVHYHILTRNATKGEYSRLYTRSFWYRLEANFVKCHWSNDISWYMWPLSTVVQGTQHM